jgi:hypothetical protein
MKTVTAWPMTASHRNRTKVCKRSRRLLSLSSCVWTSVFSITPHSYSIGPIIGINFRNPDA